MGALLVSVSLLYLFMLTTWCYLRLAKLQQETWSKYAMNLVSCIRLSSMLSSPNKYLLCSSFGTVRVSMEQNYGTYQMTILIQCVYIAWR